MEYHKITINSVLCLAILSLIILHVDCNVRILEPKELAEKFNSKLTLINIR